MKVLGSFLFVLMFFFMASSALAQDQLDLKTFLNKFELLKRIEKRTGVQTNWRLKRFLAPWGPYTKRPFSDGVDVPLQKKLVILASKGMCDEIKTIEILGFLALYPHLKPAMKRQDVRDVFRQHILPSSSWPLIHCLSLYKLKTVKLVTIGDVKVPLNFFKKTEFGKVLEEKPGYKAFQNLYTLSRCVHYAPAVADLLRLSNKGEKLYIPENVRFEFLDLIDKTEYATEFAALNANKFKSGKIDLFYVKGTVYSCNEKDPRHLTFYVLKE